jgi:hypothetical protein
MDRTLRRRTPPAGSTAPAAHCPRGSAATRDCCHAARRSRPSSARPASWRGGPAILAAAAAGVVASAASAAEIGPPIEHTRVYVLDERLMPVPVGVVGEVCLAGQGVARGYCDQPRRTARSFRPDPWSDEPAARMYRTGDLGRWREVGGPSCSGGTTTGEGPRLPDRVRCPPRSGGLRHQRPAWSSPGTRSRRPSPGSGATCSPPKRRSACTTIFSPSAGTP